MTCSRTLTVCITFCAFLAFAVGCDSSPPVSTAPGPESTSPSDARTPPGTVPDQPGISGPVSFDAPPVFDITATPSGTILGAETVFAQTDIPPDGQSVSTIREITRAGLVNVTQISTVNGSPINGLEALGRGRFFATSGGLDQAVGAGLWHVTRGTARQVGDIEAFEKANDPDATKGPAWKDPRCEINPSQGFTAGPQSNPYHLTHQSGNAALIADAAGNTLLRGSVNGRVDWVSVFTPPVRDGVAADASADPSDWRVLYPLSETTNCYVQPVPTAVATGPAGDVFVGELTGVTPSNIGDPPVKSTGLSRVWRIESGADHVTCPSVDCEVVLSGLTSIIDVAFGPSGDLFVVEYDGNGWFAATTLENPAGGTIQRCDVETGSCSVVEAGRTLPGAITFDKTGRLWVLENNIGNPTVRAVAPTDSSPASSAPVQRVEKGSPAR